MQSNITRALVAAILFTAAPSVHGAVLFFSSSPTSSGTPQNPIVPIATGFPTSVYLWAQLGANEKLLGIGVDLVHTEAAQITAVSVTPFLTNPNGSVRWDAANTLGKNTDAITLVRDLRLGAVAATGINAHLPSTFDDAVNHTFRICRIDLDPGNAPYGVLFLRISPFLTVYAFGQSPATGIFPSTANPGDYRDISFGTGDAPVNGASVGAISTNPDLFLGLPEPSCLAACGLAVAALTRRRRRRG